ncbi:hypothetical protein [Mycolicibacterium goodii]|nr:hypothetical protein [Mycolicibacterium goodii]
MPSRILDFPVFDADNHFYEPKDARPSSCPTNPIYLEAEPNP